MRSIRTTTIFAGAVLAATSLGAQGTRATVDPRWQGFLGCWQTSVSGSRGPTVCLLPTNSAARIEMLTVSDDSILSRTIVIATGQRTPVTRDGCTGWESATWSQDDRRLFTRAEFNCGGGAMQVATGMYSMTDGETFSRIEGVKTTGASRTRVVNFGWVQSVRVPPEIASRLPGLDEMPMSGARIEAAAELTTADVVEASQAVEPGVVEAWLGDRRQPFTIAGRDLRALRDAGVTPAVIDMVVAVSYPKTFAIAPGSAPGARLPDSMMRTPRSGLSAGDRDAYERQLRIMRRQSGFGSGWDEMLFPFSGAGNFNGGGFFSPFFGGAFNNWNGFGGPNWFNGGDLNRFNNVFNGGGVHGGGFVGGGTLLGDGPYVIVPARPTQTDPGRVVNGSGYSQNSGSSSGGVARPTPSVSSDGFSNGGGSNSGASSGGGSNSGASSGGSSSGGGASGGAASGGGEARTAKPRP